MLGVFSSRGKPRLAPLLGGLWQQTNNTMWCSYGAPKHNEHPLWLTVSRNNKHKHPFGCLVDQAAQTNLLGFCWIREQQTPLYGSLLWTEKINKHAPRQTSTHYLCVSLTTPTTHTFGCCGRTKSEPPLWFCWLTEIKTNKQSNQLKTQLT